MSQSTLDILREFARKAQSHAGLRDARDAFLDEWGGMSGFAKECRIEWDQSTPGSMSRNRMACAILQIVGQVEKQGGEIDWRTEMSDAELAATIKALVNHGTAGNTPADDAGPSGADSDADAAEGPPGDDVGDQGGDVCPGPAG